MQIHINPPKSGWGELCTRPSSSNDVVAQRVAAIIERVRTSGDKALSELSSEIDGVTLPALQVSAEEFAEAEAAVTPEVRQALSHALSNIRKFHEAQMPSPVSLETEPGVRCVQKAVPIRKVGLYIPGGTAPLFSTVLMLAVPAKVAGCSEVVLCTPVSRQTGKVAPEVLYAAAICGVDKVFKVGGAQAIAAMAFGTATIPAVDKIFGPGNQYVTTAKQMLGGRQVAIDMPAGPSEVMVLADATADPAFVAADLLSQAEHGSDSQVMLVCDSQQIADAVMSEVKRQSAVLDRQAMVEGALSKSRAIVFDSRTSREQIVAFANEYGAEHLIISMAEPWNIAGQITAAGSVFIGNYSPESAGDYASGTNHTLPTCGWASSCSGVNIDSFMRKITFQELSEEGLARLSDTIVTMAEAEGLAAHANAVKVRMAK
ncbi:MAG: histidinol dehydrogenase [Bacteroidales bacterium]|nr:histidinol dehydrogenase [Candidatus Cryptobacteroides choladohippi]